MVETDSEPGWPRGFIPSAAQWNNEFGLKVDVTDGGLTTPTITGGTLTGSLSLTGSLTSSAGSLSGTFGGNPTLSGAVVFSAAGTALAVTNNATVGGTLGVTGAGTFASTLGVTGVATLGSSTAAPIFGSGSNNKLTITPGTTSSTAVSLTQSGTGGISFTPVVTVGVAQGGVGAGLIANNTVRMKQLDVQPGTITWSGTTTFSAALNPLSMTTASHTGTSTNSGGILQLNTLNIGTDTVIAATAQAVTGLGMGHNVGAGAVGTRNGIKYQLASTGACTVPTFCAGSFYSIGAHNFGGVANSVAGAEGALFGGNSYARVDSGMTYSRESVGWEFNLSVRDSTGTFRKVGTQVVLDDQDAYEGKNVDTGITVASASGARGFRNAYTVSDWGSYWPINQTAAFPTSLFRSYMCQDWSTVAQGVNRGIDLLEATISDVAFRTKGFSVNGSGAAQIGTGLIEAISSGLKIGAPGRLGTGTPTVSAGGTNYQVGDLLYDDYGGIYSVATVLAGAVLTVTTPYRQPYVPGAAPANPVTTRTWQTTLQGTGCTLTLSWATGGNVTMGNGSAVATNATTGMLLIPTCAGIPTGVVGGVGGAALIVDSTNHKLYANDGGGWFALN